MSHNINSSNWHEYYSAVNMEYATHLEDFTLNIAATNLWEGGLTSYYVADFFKNMIFQNQLFNINFQTRVSYIDVLILLEKNSNWSHASETLCSHFYLDLLSHNNITAWNLMSMYQSENQDIFNVALLASNELLLAISNYINQSITPYSFEFRSVAVYDVYFDNLSYAVTNTTYFVDLIAGFIHSVVFAILIVCILKGRIGNSMDSTMYSIYDYVNELSRDKRMQFESLLQTAVFFIFYYYITIMMFDDTEEEMIEFINATFGWLIVISGIYLTYKFSIHFFGFLEASISEGRVSQFLLKQFTRDFMNNLAFWLRVLILVFRLNMYDSIDDFLDSFVVFISDFDEEELASELLSKVAKATSVKIDNEDDDVFTKANEYDFIEDLFYAYSLLWAKLFCFMLFMLEEMARLTLAIYICYLILFEVHNVTDSRKEDDYILSKRTAHNK